MDPVGKYVAIAFTIDGVRLRLDGGYLLVVQSQARWRPWEAMGTVAAPAALPVETREVDAVIETDGGVTLRGRAHCSLSSNQTSITLHGAGDFEVD